ncbi:BMP family ABC transporter substrate-binding protein [Actinocorallia lasiicapitis]
MRLLALIAAVALAGPLTAVPASAAAPFEACLVTDTGGIDDRSWNTPAWAGLRDAADATGMKVSFLASSIADDYAVNLRAMAKRGCGVIVSVGGLMGEATDRVAREYPKQRFVIVDSPSALPNVRGLQFNVGQSAFQAGYLAAARSKTGVVGTFGGLNIPPVTLFMDGFWEGVRHYNKVKKRKVKVLGWDERKPKRGLFANSFVDVRAGKRITKKLVRQGADVVFPVAGATGLGAAAVATESGGKVAVIWPDFDGCTGVTQYCSVMLTSVVKNFRLATRVAVLAAAKGQIGGSRIGTLANGGTKLASFHRQGGKVSKKTRKELAAIAKAITTGKIKITSRSQPRP